MKKALIIFGIVIALMGTMFYLVNWVFLPAIKEKEKQKAALQNAESTPCSNVVDMTGEAVTWPQVAGDELDGKTISIEGYPELPFVMMLQNGRASVHLTSRMNQASGGMIILLVEEGNCENMMQPLPENYAQEDMIFMDNAGEEIYYGESMRITGKAKIKDGKYNVTVEKIEKTELNFNYENVCVRLADDNRKKTDDQLVYAEGILTAPDEQSSLRLGLFLEDESLSFFVNALVKYGSLDNQATDPGEEYNAEEIAVFDANGKTIRPGDRVRVYGTWDNEKANLWVEKIVLLEKE